MSIDSNSKTPNQALAPTLAEHNRAYWRVCPASMALQLASIIVLWAQVLLGFLNDHAPEISVFIPVCIVALASAYFRFINEDAVNALAHKFARERVDRAADPITHRQN